MKKISFLSTSQRILRLIPFAIALLVLQCSSNRQLDQSLVQDLNHIQLIGSHNSYKQAIQPELLNFAISQDPEVSGLAYSHLPIKDQLNQGLRIIELDIYHDPKGGRFVKPLGNLLLQQQGIDVIAYNEKRELEKPGFKVFHVQDIDFRSHCLLLEDCLSEIKFWSDNHPNHLPLIITLNAKTDTLDLPGSTPPLPFTGSVFDDLDQLFESNLGIENIITPSKVKEGYETLNAAILDRGWPTMTDSRGKFLIVLDEPMEKVNTYLSNQRKRTGIMFTNARVGHEASALLVINDPIKDEHLIRRYVRQGYLVRTRADADTREAINNDYRRFQAAMRSGAQFISTDYYYKSQEQPSFLIQFDDGSFIRCNPLFENISCNL